MTREEIETFNRTIVELKRSYCRLSCTLCCPLIEPLWNWNFVDTYILEENTAFNRTIVELKLKGNVNFRCRGNAL